MMPDEAVTALTWALVDDAGLFPPEELSMRGALTRYGLNLAAHQPVLSHRLVCPAGRLNELRKELQPDDGIKLLLITPPSRLPVAELQRAVAADGRLTLVAVESVFTDRDHEEGMRALETLPASVARYLEVPFGAGCETALDVLAARGWGAKVRCGGIRFELFPDVNDLVTFIAAAVDREVGFKATAGLHHAVGYTDPRTGFDHYGFLNLLLAVHRTQSQASPLEVAEVLLSRDAANLADETRSLDIDSARRIRATFVSYGSCSTSEPVDDLAMLGLAPTREAA
jgi:hypothetical protein